MFLNWIKVASSDEALVISGKSQKTQSGEDTAVTVVINGRAVVNPFLQRCERLSLRARQVSLVISAQSLDNVTLQVEGVASVKVGSTKDLVRKAAERFVSQDSAIESFTTEQLEGALRGVVATLSVDQLMRERKQFSEQITAEVARELAAQGLILDYFQIKGISDQVGYIASLGTPEIEEKRRAAEIAQTNSEREITKSRISVDEMNLIERTAYEKNQADSAAQVGKARAIAEQAEELSRVEAAQNVLKQRAANRQVELEAEVKKVADADAYRRQTEADANAYEQDKHAEVTVRQAQADAEAAKLHALAHAEAIRAEGQAKADAIRAEAEALKANHEALLSQRVVEVLPQLMESYAQGYQNVGSVTVIGGGGTGSSAHLGTDMAATFETLRKTTGIDIPDLLQGAVQGSAIGNRLAEAHQATSERSVAPRREDSEARDSSQRSSIQGSTGAEASSTNHGDAGTEGTSEN